MGKLTTEALIARRAGMETLKSPDVEVWYRYEDQSRPHFDPWSDGDYTGSSPEVVVHEYRVKRHTPKGVWLSIGCGERWVSHHTVKRFACATKKEAGESFMARKKAQHRILSKQLAHVESVMKIYEHRGEGLETIEMFLR